MSNSVRAGFKFRDQLSNLDRFAPNSNTSTGVKLCPDGQYLRAAETSVIVGGAEQELNNLKNKMADIAESLMSRSLLPDRARELAQEMMEAVSADCY